MTSKKALETIKKRKMIMMNDSYGVWLKKTRRHQPYCNECLFYEVYSNDKSTLLMKNCDVIKVECPINIEYTDFGIHLWSWDEITIEPLVETLIIK